MLSPRRLAALLLLAPAAGASLTATAQGSPGHAAASAPTATAAQAGSPGIPVRDPGPPPGAQRLKFRFGPMKIRPGQNLINLDVLKDRPQVDGWIVGFRPGLVNVSDGKSPSVKTVHLHHAVWLVGEPGGGLAPTFAAGEEKTYFNAPRGFGWRYTTEQTWLINHMIHDLVGSSHRVYLTFELWFIPDTAPEAADITRIDTQWMDVQGVKPYPVFDALRGSGAGGTLTYPDQEPGAYRDGVVRNRWVAERNGTMVSTAGHLHPGGLWTDLSITRDGVTRRIFRSRANYFDPAGPVSWDLAMSATSEDWRVNFRKGDVITTSATYDTSRASWYEVMGIMIVGATREPVAGGVDPFEGTVDQTDTLTHGRLPENIDTNVRERNPGLSNPLRLRGGPRRERVAIRNFVYERGDLSQTGRAGLPPTVVQGRSLTFVNRDEPLTERFHTITACRAPCNLTGGIGYPLANGPVRFDSGELGFGPSIDQSIYAGSAASVPITAAVNTPAPRERCKGVPGLVNLIANGCVGRTTWRTPKTLKPGTYTYFCRVHPFMRGAFRVVARPKRA